VSTLSSTTEPAVAAAIERAHQAAVNDALSFIEQQGFATALEAAAATPRPA
jgi:hypothetical protein